LKSYWRGRGLKRSLVKKFKRGRIRQNWKNFSKTNSLNIPFLELVSKPEKYIKDKNQSVITYCNYGNRSGQATQILREKGYKIFVLEGGIENYFSKTN
jgi:rhodanese-related sulfurtransferase